MIACAYAIWNIITIIYIMRNVFFFVSYFIKCFTENNIYEHLCESLQTEINVQVSRCRLLKHCYLKCARFNGPRLDVRAFLISRA